MDWIKKNLMLGVLIGVILWAALRLWNPASQAMQTLKAAALTVLAAAGLLIFAILAIAGGVAWIGLLAFGALVGLLCYDAWKATSAASGGGSGGNMDMIVITKQAGQDDTGTPSDGAIDFGD